MDITHNVCLQCFASSSELIHCLEKQGYRHPYGENGFITRMTKWKEMLTRVQQDRKENLNAAEENRKKILKDRPVKEVVTSETANEILDSIDLDMF